MTCDIRYDSQMMLELSLLPPLIWLLLTLCIAPLAAYWLAEHPRPGWWLLLQQAWWVALMVFASTAGAIAAIAMHLRSYGCDIAYVTAWTNPFGRLPQTLAVSALAVLITGVALCVEKHGRKAKP